MKKNLIIGMALLGAMTLTGCTKGKEIIEERVPLQVNGGIQTKAVGNTWESGDAIGIYMLRAGTSEISEAAENRRYTTTADGNSTFTSTADQIIYFPVDGSDVDFIAYYPYQAQLNDGAMTIDVSSQTNIPSIDLMAAKILSTNEEPLDKDHYTVAFRFSHKLTKIELNIENGSGLTPEDLQGLTVQITNQRTEASYNLLAETLALTTEDTQSVTFHTNSDGSTAEAILLPNSENFNPGMADRELVFTLNGTGEVFRYVIPVEKSFRAGDRNIYNITINRGGVSVTATITNWNPVDNGRVDAE